MGLQPEQVGIGLGGPAGAGKLEMGDHVAVRADEDLEESVLDRSQVQEGLADVDLVAAGGTGTAETAAESA